MDGAVGPRRRLSHRWVRRGREGGRGSGTEADQPDPRSIGETGGRHVERHSQSTAVIGRASNDNNCKRQPLMQLMKYLLPPAGKLGPVLGSPITCPPICFLALKDAPPRNVPPGLFNLSNPLTPVDTTTKKSPIHVVGPNQPLDRTQGFLGVAVHPSKCHSPFRFFSRSFSCLFSLLQK